MEIEDELQEALKRALPGIAVRIQNELILNCPVDKGRTRASIKVKSTEEGIMITMAETGKFIEFGTNPHIIEAKNGGVLRFEVGRVERLSGKTKGKNIVFAKKVKHPGTRPNPFIRTMIQTKLKQIVIEEINRQL